MKKKSGSYLDHCTDHDIESLQQKNEMLLDLIERRAIRNVYLDIACEILEHYPPVTFRGMNKKEIFQDIKQIAKSRGHKIHSYEKKKSADEPNQLDG